MSELDVNDWPRLAAEWQRAVPSRLDIAELERRVVAERRRMLFWVAGDVGVSVGAVVTLWWIATHWPGPATTLLIVETCIMSAAIWAFSLWNRRGLWRPLGESTAAFVATTRLRYARRLAALRFAEIWVVAQIAIVFAWRRWGPHWASDAMPSVVAWAVPAAVVFGFVEGIEVLRHRTVRALAELDRIAGPAEMLDSQLHES